MYSLIRYISYQNSLNRRCILIFPRHIEIDRKWIRAFCSKKEVIDKLDNLEQKIQSMVHSKTVECLNTKCKHSDTTLPECSPSEAVADPGRRASVKSIPPVCPPKPNESDECIRPYVNPCPPHPLKICSPSLRPVHPCRDPCKRPEFQIPKDNKIMELDIRMMRILLALTTLVAAYILYRMYNKQDEVVVEVKGAKVRRTQKPPIPPKVPQYGSELPGKVPYIIIGGGTAAYSAMKKLVELDENAKILMINKEHYYPYHRNPLNSELLLTDPVIAKELQYLPRGADPKGRNSRKNLYYENEEFYQPLTALDHLEKPGNVVSMARGWEVLKVDVDKKRVYVEGKTISYEKCILATGSSPKNLRVFTENSDDVRRRASTFTTLYDYQLLDEVMDTYKGDITIAVVGGGLNGTKLACTLRQKGARVIQIITEKGNMDEILPRYLSDWLTKRVESSGITILPESEILDALIWKGGDHDGNVALYVNSKKNKNFLVFADHVLVSVGNIPNTSMAEASGLEVDKESGGFLVNRELQIRQDLYAAGDCISYYDSMYGRRHFEYWEHAMESGKIAAENIMSQGKTYDHQSTICSNLLDGLGFEAVGTIDSTLPTVGIYYNGDKTETVKNDPQSQTEQPNVKLEEFNKGIVFYLNNKEKIMGILTWNVFNRATLLRRILGSSRSYNDCDELTKLFHIDT